MSDEQELTARLRAGDGSALAAYIELVRGPLTGYVRRQIGPSLARKVEPDDIVQEVHIHAHRALAAAGLDEREPFGWLCRLADQRIIDESRKFAADKRDARREVPIGGGGSDSSSDLIQLLVASFTSASQAFQRDHRHQLLAGAMAELPEVNREALRLRYQVGLPSKEIADRLGKSDAAVRVLLSRTIAKLQELLAGAD